MTDIAEILKECPKGTKLYSPICGECYLYCVGDLEIRVNDNSDVIYRFFEDGRQHLSGECLLFPSKENRDWSTFNNTKRFKKGDFINNRDFICIYNGINKYGAIQFFAFIPWNWDRNTSTEMYYVSPAEKPKIGIGYINNETRLATEDEKTLLLSAIGYKGYVWDAEKFELRKKEPEFKVKEPEFKVFDRVLVRNTNQSLWKLAEYAFRDKECKEGDFSHFTVGGICWKYCIPYEGNEHLLGTPENCE